MKKFFLAVLLLMPLANAVGEDSYCSAAALAKGCYDVFKGFSAYCYCPPTPPDQMDEENFTENHHAVHCGADAGKLTCTSPYFVSCGYVQYPHTGGLDVVQPETKW